MARKPPSRRASDMRWREQHFLYQGRLPVGHMSVIAGSPAKGKSTLGYRIAADADVPTIFVTSEETDLQVWGPRVEAAGVDLAKAFHHREVKFSRNPDDLKYLEELIDMYAAQLVVVDPINNHLYGASISQNDQVRRVFEPYLELIQDKDVALLLQMHVLNKVSEKLPAQAAVPAGVRSVAKAIYLFGDDPTTDDPNFRVLANAQKFNFGPEPASLVYEYELAPVKVYSERSRRWKKHLFGRWIDRGETQTTAKMIVASLAPAAKETKTERASTELFKLLREGPMNTLELKRHFNENVHPRISWHSVLRAKKDMEIEEEQDPSDKRLIVWSLYGLSEETADEADDDDEIIMEEVDLPDVPDTIPEDWDLGEEGAA